MLVQKNGNKIGKIIGITIISVIVLFSALIININATDAFKYMFLLPIVHGMLMLLFSPRAAEMFEYPVQVIVYAGLFIRNVLTPLVLSGSYSLQKIKISNQQIVNLGIFLMIYETIIIFIVLSGFFNREKQKKEKYIRLICGQYNNIFSVIFFLIVSAVIVLWFVVPEISMRYDSIFNIDVVINLASNVNKDNIANSTRALFTIGTMLFNICRYLLSAIILFFVRKKSDKTYVGVIATLIVLFLNLLFISTEVALIFFIAIYLYLVAKKLWPPVSKILAIIFLIAGTISIVLLAFVKSGLDSKEMFIASIGSMLQAYFPGIFNMCGTIIMSKTDILNTVFADLYSIIPFRNSIFGLQVMNTADLFNSYNGMAGQIVPLLGESYYLFGGVFAPILSGMFVYLSISISKKMKKCKDIIRYVGYSLSAIYLSIGTICYNMIIIGQTFTALIIPIFILSFFSHDKYFLQDELYDKN